MTRLTHTTEGRPCRWLHATVLAMGLLLTTSCSKALLMAPSGSTIKLFVNQSTAGPGAAVTVTALVTEAGNTPVHDGTVVYFFATIGTMSPSQATTTNGQATAQLLTGTASGTSEISATSGGATLASTVKVTVGAAAASRVELSANPTTLPSTGGATTLTATVTDAGGSRLSGIVVTFRTDKGELSPDSATTDANGQAYAQLTTLQTAKVTASVAGGAGDAGGATSNLVTVGLRTPPNAALTGVPASSGFSVTLTYLAFPGADGVAIRSVSIAFGDGGSQSALAPTDQGLDIIHAYGVAGTFVAVLTVTDMAGETTTASAAFVVR